MPNPQPIQSTLKSVIAAQRSLEKIYVATGASGKFVKLGSVTRTDLQAVNADFVALKDQVQQLLASTDYLIQALDYESEDGAQTKEVEETVESVETATPISPTFPITPAARPFSA